MIFFLMQAKVKKANHCRAAANAQNNHMRSLSLYCTVLYFALLNGQHMCCVYKNSWCAHAYLCYTETRRWAGRVAWGWWKD